MTPLKVYIGFEPRERDAYLVAAHTLRQHASIPLMVEPLVLEHLRWKRLYNRPHEMRDGRIWDGISGAPMATEFALTRFLVPHLAGYRGLALFCDCDFLVRADVAALLAGVDERLALQLVKHAEYRPAQGAKMDRQIQTAYPRKNWSSFVLWNCAHEAHAGTLERVNRWRGLALHQFRWIPDEEIGGLERGWNYLVGHGRAAGEPIHAAHFTDGIPSMAGYEHAEFADEWRAALAEASGRADLRGHLERVGAWDA